MACSFCSPPVFFGGPVFKIAGVLCAFHSRCVFVPPFGSRLGFVNFNRGADFLAQLPQLGFGRLGVEHPSPLVGVEACEAGRIVWASGWLWAGDHLTAFSPPSQTGAPSHLGGIVVIGVIAVGCGKLCQCRGVVRSGHLPSNLHLCYSDDHPAFFRQPRHILSRTGVASRFVGLLQVVSHSQCGGRPGRMKDSDYEAESQGFRASQHRCRPVWRPWAGAG